MILKKLLVILIIVICSVNPTTAMTKEEISNGIIKNCECMYTDIGDLIYCILSQSYAHNKIISHYRALITNNEDRNKLRELITKHKDKLKIFHGFVTLHLEFEEWLEREHKKGGR